MNFKVLNILYLCFAFVSSCKLASDWWENVPIYHIFPASFRDTDGNGFGDIKGITEKLGYIKSLGMEAIWISPIYKSPFLSFGYDISDYKSINPQFGSMEDFEFLVDKASKLGIKIIMDIVPNHSSWDHDWFQKSIERDPQYENYYVWHPGKIDDITGLRVPPNNWLCMTGRSAWKWNVERKEYYYFQFSKHMPDFNFREEKVRQEFLSIFEFWLKKGVSGFRIDAIAHLFEIAADENGFLPDEPKSGITEDEFNFSYLDHIYTTEQSETYDVVYDWRDFLDGYKKDNRLQTILLLTESYADVAKLIRYYGANGRDGSHVPLNFQLMTQIHPDTNVSSVENIVERFLNAIPDKKYKPNWIIGNHDGSRVATRMGTKRIDLMNALQMTLPGLSVTYNGEEIGMTDVCLIYPDDKPTLCSKEGEGSFNYDVARSPMQWDDSTSAGFSSNSETWLPVHQNYKTVNVKLQELDDRSNLNIFRDLIALRKKYEAIRKGGIEIVTFNDDVLGYVR